MKFIMMAAALFLFACNSNEKAGTSMSIAGTYKMTSQNLKGEKLDTNYNSAQQLKIYTDDAMMYANWNPTDSASNFGVAHYTMNGDTLTEHAIYGAGGKDIATVPAEFKLLIAKTDKGYNQIIKDMADNSGQKFTLTESYENVGTAGTSPLDGLWEQTHNYTVTGKDTVNQTNKQYKAYWAGHFIFAHTWSDSLKVNHTGMGFGTFSMTGTDKVTEKVQTSTYDIRGRTFNIDVMMDGKDAFKQTITDTSGVKMVEHYMRIKKS